MDPFWLPIYSMLPPFEVPKYNHNQKWTDKSFKFQLPDTIYTLLHSNHVAKSMVNIQVRWIRLPPLPTSDLEWLTPANQSPNLKGYEHGFPKTGYLRVNNGFQKSFETPPPPNDQKRRKDDMFDIQKWVRLQENYLEIGHKYTPKDNERYFWGVFLCKNFTKKQIVGYYKRKSKESAITCVNKLKSKLGLEINKVDQETGRPLKRAKHDEDDIMMDRTIRYKFNWPITWKRLTIPVKGFYCEHMECFDLESFISMNTNFRSLKCPTCNKKAVDLYVDTLTQKMLTILPPKTEQIEIKDDLVAYCDSGVDIDLQKLAIWIENQSSDIEIKNAWLISKEDSNEANKENIDNNKVQQKGKDEEDFDKKHEKMIDEIFDMTEWSETNLAPKVLTEAQKVQNPVPQTIELD